MALEPNPQLGGTYTSGPRQWLRKSQLVVGNREGSGLDLSELRFSFKIQQAEIQTPNAAWIRVYNPFRDTVQRIGATTSEAEFKRVTLHAGYQDGNYGLIFQGDIKQARYGRDNATTTYMEILASDGDEAYNFATVSMTLAAGSSPRDMIQQAANAMAQFGVTLGPLPDTLPNVTLPRAITLHAMARDVMRAVSAWSGCNWSIVNGVITMTPTNGYVEGEAVVLTAYTGMIGMPEQTEDGLRVRCLINPKIFPGRLIKVDNKSVQQARFGLQYGAEVRNETIARIFPTTGNDGYYRVIAVDVEGDTRGQEWYYDLICYSIAPGAMTPLSAPQRPAGALGSDVTSPPQPPTQTGSGSQPAPPPTQGPGIG